MEKTSQYSEKLLHRKLDLLLRTGKLLMESARTRAASCANMKRTAAYLGLPDEHLHIYINYNMLMVNLGDEEHSFSKFPELRKTRHQHDCYFSMCQQTPPGEPSARIIRWKNTRRSGEKSVPAKRNYTPGR